jgi:stage II sporulation protein R
MKIRFFACILALIAVFGMCAPALAEPLADREMIRLHILAHSDSPADQGAKLAVRDAVRAAFKRRVDGARTADEAYAALEDAREELRAAAEAALRAAGFDYGARVELGAFEFPDRTYDGVLVPAGTYRAIRISLGDGAGQNWWCVLYPDLCFVDAACRRQAADGKPIAFYSIIGRWLSAHVGGEVWR